MKLPDSAHTSRPWRIHEVAGDLRVEDVWALPTPGGPDDFPRLVELVTSFDPEREGPLPVRVLFAVRWRIGALLGLDDDGPAGRFPFTPLYELEDEWAGEIVNRTVRGVLHLGWVPDGSGGYRGQLAVLVKPNGLLGSAYMAAITPFRLAIVYPLMLRELGRRWAASTPAAGRPAPRAPRRRGSSATPSG